MNNLVKMIEEVQEVMRADHLYSYRCADMMDPILEEAKKDGWIPVEEQPYPQAVGDYFVSGLYAPAGEIPRRIVGEADFIGGKWLIANDFTLEAWRPKLEPYKVGEEDGQIYTER